jgi:hypothetical protein
MSTDKALRCDCGYEVRPAGELARVDAVRRHAREAHGIELTVELALVLVRRSELVPSGELTHAQGKENK